LKTRRLDTTATRIPARLTAHTTKILIRTKEIIIRVIIRHALKLPLPIFRICFFCLRISMTPRFSLPGLFFQRLCSSVSQLGYF